MRTEKQKDICRLVSFGNGGDTVYLEARSEFGGGTCTGYGKPERPHAADFTSERKTNVEVPDGTPVIDIRPALETDQGYKWVFKGPMPSVKIKDEEVSACPDLKDSLVAQAMMRDDNAYGTMATLQLCHQAQQKTEPGPLDMVSVSAYVKGWKEHGARIGHY